MKPEETALYFKDAKSDKVYQAFLKRVGKLFVVNFSYGKRGGTLKTGTKTSSPIAYEKAKAIYDKLVKSKTDKGYAPDDGSVTLTSAPKSGAKRKSPKSSGLPGITIEKSESIVLSKPDPKGGEDVTFRALMERIGHDKYEVFTYDRYFEEKQRTPKGGCGYKKAKSLYNAQVNRRKKDHIVVSAMDPSWNANLEVGDLVATLNTLIETEEDVVPFLLKLSNYEKASIEADVRALIWPSRTYYRQRRTFTAKQELLVDQVAFVCLSYFELHARGHDIQDNLHAGTYDDILKGFVPSWFSKAVRKDGTEYFRAMNYAKFGYWNLKDVEKQFGNNIINSLMDKDGKVSSLKKLDRYPETLEDHIFNIFYYPPEYYWGVEKAAPVVFSKLLSQNKISRKKLITHLFNEDVKKYAEEYSRTGRYTNYPDEDCESYAQLCLNIAKAINLTPSEMAADQWLLLQNIWAEKEELRDTVYEMLGELLAKDKLDVEKLVLQLDRTIGQVSNTKLKKLLPFLDAVLQNHPDLTTSVCLKLAPSLKDSRKNVHSVIDKFLKNHGADDVIKSVNAALDTAAKPKAITAEDLGGWTEEQIEKVSQLLLSADDGNTKIAFSLLENRDFPKLLLTEVFAIFKTTADEVLKQTALDIIEAHGSDALKQQLKSKLSLGFGNTKNPATEKTIKRNIKSYVAGNELDGLKLAQALYERYSLGVAYLLDESPEDKQVEMFKTFLKGTVLKLHDKALTKFPAAMFKFPDLTEIDLTDNKIAKVPSEIALFKKLKILNLSGNNLKTIDKNIKELQKLEELYLNDNLMKKAVPREVFELANLRRLDLTAIQDQNKQFTLPENIVDLKKLEWFKLDHSRWMSHHDSYDNYPKIKEVTGSPLDMAPLAISEAAFDQGDLSPVAYIFKHGGETLVKKALDKFYDPASKTFDFEKQYINVLPKEILDYEVRHLNLKNTKMGSDKWQRDEKINAEDIAKTEIISKLTQLETLNVASCGFVSLADLSTLKKLKILNLEGNNLNDLFDLASLGSLEELDISGNNFRQVPESIFKISCLKKLWMYDSFYYDNDANPEDFKDLRDMQNLDFFRLYTFELRQNPDKVAIIRSFIPEGCEFVLPEY